jgi:hypothetical protein
MSDVKISIYLWTKDVTNIRCHVWCYWEQEFEEPMGTYLTRGGIDGLKNRSGKCEGPARGDQWVKEPKWEMRRTGRGDWRVKESEWEMRRIGQGGIDELKNQSEKCEGPAGGLDRLKNRSGKCEGPGRGVNKVKNRIGKCEGPGRGGDQRLFEKNFFLEKTKNMNQTLLK